MSEFGASALLEVTIDEASAAQARRELENKFSDPTVQVQGPTRPSQRLSRTRPDGGASMAGFAGGSGAIGVLEEIREINEDMLEELEEGGMGGGAGGESSFTEGAAESAAGFGLFKLLAKGAGAGGGALAGLASPMLGLASAPFASLLGFSQVSPGLVDSIGEQETGASRRLSEQVIKPAVTGDREAAAEELQELREEGLIDEQTFQRIADMYELSAENAAGDLEGAAFTWEDMVAAFSDADPPTDEWDAVVSALEELNIPAPGWVERLLGIDSGGDRPSPQDILEGREESGDPNPFTPRDESQQTADRLGTTSTDRTTRTSGGGDAGGNRLTPVEGSGTQARFGHATSAMEGSAAPSTNRMNEQHERRTGNEFVEVRHSGRVRVDGDGGRRGDPDDREIERKIEEKVNRLMSSTGRVR